MVKRGSTPHSGQGPLCQLTAPKTYGHLDLAFLGSSEGDGLGSLRKNVRLPKIVFGVGVICILIALAMVNESKLGVENILGFMF